MADEKLKSFRGNTQAEAEASAKEWVSSHPEVNVTKSVSTCITQAAGAPEAAEIWHTHIHYTASN